jgi:hypothetical protein
MELSSAIEVLKKEYTKNNQFDLEKVEDKLQFLISLTVVQQSLESGNLKEADYLKQVIKVLE